MCIKWAATLTVEDSVGKGFADTFVYTVEEQ